MHIRLLDILRRRQPLVHNITNPVSAYFTANGLLALGASPMMAEDPAEMAELAAASSALVLNLGTPSADKTAAMLAAGQAANRAGIPVVLDPVAVGASTLRRDTVAQLRRHIRFALIRGNAAEIGFLAGAGWQGKGVDAGSGGADLAERARQAAQQCGCTVILSGARDYVSDGRQTAALDNGSPLMPKITASGCLFSAVTGAFAAVADADHYFQAALEACAVYAVAGEMAADGLPEHAAGRFAVRFLDALGGIQAADAEQAARLVYL